MEIEILRQGLDWRAEHRRIAICTVAATWGSAPKPVGSHLIVDSNGAFLGSISGGCIEGDVIAEAIDVISSGTSRLLEFGVSDERAWNAGLTCGGQIKVYVEQLSDELADCLTTIMRDDADRKPSVLITSLDGRAPRTARAEVPSTEPLAQQIKNCLRTGKSGLVTEANRQWLMTTFVPATRLVVFGAVHITQALTKVATLADLEMIVVDPRSAFATSERFPETRLIADWPQDAAPSLGLGPSDAVAALSHDPKIDDQGLLLALAAGCFYIGALGSRRSHVRRLDRLRAAGVSEPDLHRLHAPIGLAIGAEGPDEIAISIVAEIIAVKRAPVAIDAPTQAA